MTSSLGAAPTRNFDVFLCHNSADKPTIRAIAHYLQQHNISYWLDEEQLPPGCHWLETQERDMSQLKSVAVFVGQHGIGKWQRIGISIFLQRFVEHDLRVIPVFLADAPPETDLMMFLKLFTWVDFRRSDPDPMQLLLQGITRDRTNANSVPIAEAKRIIAADIKAKFQVPYLRNVYFTGRSQLLQDLHAELTGTGVAALSQVAAIAGLGGIGKTQTAVEYAYRHFPVEYDWVFWVKSETELSAVTDLAAMGRSLGLAGVTLDELAMAVQQRSGKEISDAERGASTTQGIEQPS